MDDFSFEERRRYPRAEFTYPVSIKIISRINESPVIKAYLRDISEGGACVFFEDRYERIDLGELSSSKIKITVSLANREKIIITSNVKRVRKDTPEQFCVEMGVEFYGLEDWHNEAIKQLISLKNKDHNMLWNLWESYESKY